MTKAERYGGRSDSEDLPTIAASIIATIPPMMFKIGFKYLAMKKRVQKSARAMEAGMRASGMPEHVARRLSIRYEEDSRFLEMILKAVLNKETLRSWTSAAGRRAGN